MIRGPRESRLGHQKTWAEIAIWIFGEIFNLFDPNCDGGVVAQTISTTTAEMMTMTHNGTTPFRKTLQYPGTDSAVGCGANSLYDVTYSITYQHLPDPKRGGERGDM